MCRSCDRFEAIKAAIAAESKFRVNAERGDVTIRVLSETDRGTFRVRFEQAECTFDLDLLDHEVERLIVEGGGVL